MATEPLDLVERFVPGGFPDPIEDNSQQSLGQQIYARRHEYTEPKKIRLKIGSWNVGNFSCFDEISAWFPEKSEKGNAKPDDQHLEELVDLYVLGLQEIVDVASPAEALRPYTDPSIANRYRESVSRALPENYKLVAEQQLVGLLILVFASHSLYSDIRSVATTSVGTGLMGYMGNKGAVTVHLILGESTRLVFVNSHLAAGSDKVALERRNWDASTIISRTRFINIDDPSGIPNPGESIGDEDFGFWFGDLNYRLESIPGDDVRRLLSLHVRNKYDIRMALKRIKSHSKSENTEIIGMEDYENEYDNDNVNDNDNDNKDENSKNRDDHDHIPEVEDQVQDSPDDQDPASLQTTLSSLLPHDELKQQIRSRKAFHHGWKEGTIKFLPTYKYDTGTVAVFDSSEKKRGPSWCDRILYRTRNGIEASQRKIIEEEKVRQRMEELSTQDIHEDENVMFDYDPEDDLDEEDSNSQQPDTKLERVKTKDGLQDEICLEKYISHQRILSSDHKPLSATFNLTYQAVNAEKKSRIDTELRREMDRRQNELHPVVTIAMDRFASTKDASQEPRPSWPDEAIDFGKVGYQKEKRISSMIANTGQVPAVLSFIDRPTADLGKESPTPEWISIRWDREPDSKDKKAKVKSKDKDKDFHTNPTYTLQPGDACTVEFLLMIGTPEMAESLNNGEMRLEDVLIMRVENGRDHFLPIQAKWQKSDLDISLKSVKSLSEESLRKLQGQKPEAISESTERK